ncbi:hypothetical protein FACS1894166_11140 [Bacilli bacterium]|nr:hypothetical protein FACS1894166_11140 [Bacilli bacterium]
MSQQINHAYSILSDEQKRKQYDQGLIDSQGNPTNPYSQGFSGGSPFAGSPFGSSGQTFHFTSAGADGIDIEDILKNFGFGGTPHKTQQTRHSAKTPDDFEETF